MLEKQKNIDAVLVATPDHTTPLVAMAAMQLGKHVYVQKPLTRTISEARALTEAARKYKVVTQMGNQGHSEEGLRLMQEWLEAGAIGQVREVHCWTNRPIWPQGMPRPTEQQAVPDGLDWEMWIGPAPMRPFHKTYHPFGWRAWQDFGAGAMGDMACHVMDASSTILKLGAPTSVIASLGYNFLPPAPGQRGFGQRVEYNDSYPPSSIIHLSFPARGNMPPVKLHWYDGGLLPELPEDLEPEPEAAGVGHDLRRRQGQDVVRDLLREPAPHPGDGHAGLPAPAEDSASRVPEGRDGHEKNWLDAIRQKGQAVSNFDYAGPFTEIVLLGNVALRYPGQRLLWDSATMKVTNMPDADQFVQHNYRPGLVALGPAVFASNPRAGAGVAAPAPTLRLLHACWWAGRRRRARDRGTARARATCGASRTRRWRPSSRCTPCTPMNGTRRRRRRPPSISRTASRAS